MDLFPCISFYAFCSMLIISGIMFYVYSYMHLVLDIFLYAYCSLHLFICISLYASISLHLILYNSFHASHLLASNIVSICFYAFCFMKSCISLYTSYLMYFILYISFYASHHMHLIKSILFYASPFMHFNYCWNSLTQTDRPTDRRTLSRIELLSQLKKSNIKQLNVFGHCSGHPCFQACINLERIYYLGVMLHICS